MTEKERVYISALAAMYEHPETSQPFLCVYHNYFAEIPLPPEIFRGTNDRHFRKPVHPNTSPQEWEEVPTAAAGALET
jgi:hypothetical protein